MKKLNKKWLKKEHGKNIKKKLVGKAQNLSLTDGEGTNQVGRPLQSRHCCRLVDIPGPMWGLGTTESFSALKPLNKALSVHTHTPSLLKIPKWAGTYECTPDQSLESPERFVSLAWFSLCLCTLFSDRFSIVFFHLHFY